MKPRRLKRKAADAGELPDRLAVRLVDDDKPRAKSRPKKKGGKRGRSK